MQTTTSSLDIEFSVPRDRSVAGEGRISVYSHDGVFIHQVTIQPSSLKLSELRELDELRSKFESRSYLSPYSSFHYDIKVLLIHYRPTELCIGLIKSGHTSQI